MPYTKLPQSSHNVFLKRQQSINQQQSHRGVRQDKSTTNSARRATSQPAPSEKRMRPHPLNSKSSRSQTRLTPKRKTVHLTLWVKPGVKAELQRKAEQEGISLSATGGVLLERALQQNIDMQYSALIQPAIERAFEKKLGGIIRRLAWLLVRIAFDGGQTRSIAANILRRQPGMTDPMLKTILEESAKSAKANIARRTPQMLELFEALEAWILAESEEQEHHAEWPL
jgi:hypothetical protein